MPTYTYRCANCNYHFDQHMRFEDPDPDRCPNCETAGPIQRVYKPVGVVFKGSGFYATDHKSGAVKPANGKENTSGDSAKSASDASESKTDKPAAKSGGESSKPAAGSGASATPPADA